MKKTSNPNYPSIADLRKKVKKIISRSAFEYLDGGCNSGTNLKRNTSEIRDIYKNKITDLPNHLII